MKSLKPYQCMNWKLPKILEKEKNVLTIGERLREVASEIMSNKGNIKKSKPSLLFLSKELKITEMQTKILSCVVCSESVFNFSYRSVSISEIVNWLKLSDLIKTAKKNPLKDIIIPLLEKNYVTTEESYNEGLLNGLSISEWFSTNLEKSELEVEKQDNLDTLGLIVELSNYLEPLVSISKRSYYTNNRSKTRYMTPDLCYRLIKDLFEKNLNLRFVKEFNKLVDQIPAQRLKTNYCLTILALARQLVIRGYNTISFDELEGIFAKDNQSIIDKIRVSFLYNQNELFGLNIIEEAGQDWKGQGVYKLTDAIIDSLLEDIDLKKHKSSKLIYPETITEKDLFYESSFYKRLEDLGSFIEKEKFQEIKDRLKEKGFKSGLSCLFYGSPGTGKTESVYQLARKTGRPIYPVDLSEIRDKFVGESEKRLKDIFTRYKKMVNDRKQDLPILLFNEADGIIGTRIKNGKGNSVDKMENTLQNILLQELEDFEGILIATTNLQGNLDKAFERRFLYKLKFPVPNPEIKAKIWLSKIEELSGDDAIKLSEEFDLSGGQIDNIARKFLIEKILHGDNNGYNYEELREYCKEEKIEMNGNRNKIGFIHVQ